MKRAFRIFIPLGILSVALFFGYQWYANRNVVEYKDPQFSAEQNRLAQERLAKTQETIMALPDGAPLLQRYPLMLQLGSDYMFLGELKKARGVYRDVIKLDKNRAPGWAQLFHAERAMHLFSDARKSIGEAIKRDPLSAQYWRWRIDLERFDLKGSDEDIRKLYAEALTSTREHADILSSYAQYLESIGDIQGAIAQWKILATRYPNESIYTAEIRRLETR